MGLKKESRIKKNEEFQRILNLKNYVSSPSFSLYFSEKEELKGRFGFTVGKKLGGAVERNKIKRQVRMMIHELSDLNESFDLIVMVRSAYLNKDYAENKKDLENSRNKVRIKMR